MRERANIYLARLSVILSLIVLVIILLSYRITDTPLGKRVWIAFPIAFLASLLFIISSSIKSNFLEKVLFWKVSSKILSLLSILLVVISLVSLIPPVKKQLKLKDHYWQYGINQYTGGLDLASQADFFDPEFGAILLKDKQLVENKIKTTAYEDYWRLGKILTSRGNYVLCYLGLKFQGLSNKDILDHSKGREILLGLMVAELKSVDWWKDVDWLKKELNLSPSETSKLGLISFDDFREIAQGLFLQKEKLSKEEMFAFIYVLGRQFGLLSQKEKTELFERWAKLTSKEEDYTNYNYFSAMGEILKKRENFIAFVDSLAENGKIAIKIDFPSESQIPEKIKKYYKETLYAFVSLCGYIPVEGDKVLITATIAPKDFDALAIEDITISEKVVTKRTTHKKYNTTYQEKVRDIKRDYKDVSGRILSLILTIETNNEYIELVAPPCGASLSEKTMTEARVFFENRPKNKDEEFTLNFYLKNHAASPWQFGVIDWDYLEWDKID
jgi:hypothetical protein